MFVEPTELKTDLYQYQLDQIIEEDETIVISGIMAAIEEVKSYFTANDQIQWLDGRPRYDAEAIFSATGANRNPLVLAYVKDVSCFHILQLSNADVIWESAKEKYDRAIAYLVRLQKGHVNISSLPRLVIEPDEQQEDLQAFRMGSRPKFNHE